MRSKQLLALMMALAVTAQPQMVSASDSADPASEVQVQTSAEETETAGQTASETADQTETPNATEEDQETSAASSEAEQTKNAADEKAETKTEAAGTKAKAVKTSEKLATVRVTQTDVYGIVGGRVSLVGNYDQGYPSVPRDGVVWCDGDKNPLSDGDKYSTTTSTTMTLKNITKDQDGQTFYLSATNAAGTAYSEAVTLHVLDASAEDQSVQIGGTATLSVNLEGNWGSPVRYQWYKGDEKIQPIE